MEKQMIVPKLTLLNEKQVWGDNRLNIFKVINACCAPTDTAILRGAKSWPNMSNSNKLISKTNCSYHLKDDNYSVHCFGKKTESGYGHRLFGVRLVLPYDPKFDYPFIVLPNGLIKITYGFYPKTAESVKNQKILELAFNRNDIVKLEANCTFDSTDSSFENREFSPEVQNYYKWKGKIESRIKPNLIDSTNEYLYECLNDINGEEPENILTKLHSNFNNNYIWVRVEPITWLKHPDDNLMISENCIISGIRFCDLEPFLNNYLSKDIISLYNEIGQQNSQKNTTFYFDEDEKNIVKSKKKSKI